jgi:hypothetical protein
MPSWFRPLRAEAKMAEADAAVLVAIDRNRAYSEARGREREASTIENDAHWSRVARIVARLTGKRIGVDTATRMAEEADFGDHGGPNRPKRGPSTEDIDQLEELQRLMREGK